MCSSECVFHGSCYFEVISRAAGSYRQSNETLKTGHFATRAE